MRAYNEMYLSGAQRNMAVMFDWAVNNQKLELGRFFQIFIRSGLAEAFGQGDPAIVAGRSGVELGMMVLDMQDAQCRACLAPIVAPQSPECWAGCAYAYYQWETGIDFSRLSRLAPVDDVARLYDECHRLDLKQLRDRLDLMVAESQPDTNLKLARLRAGLSQSDLSRISGVSLRTIQHYEQRSKDINKASWESIAAMCRALHCRPEDIVEPLPRERYK